MANDINIYGKFKSRIVGGALIEDTSIVGSYHTVQTILDRDNIPEQVRKIGMAVYVTDTSTLYVLNQDLSNDSWIIFTPFEDLSIITTNDVNLIENTISLIANNSLETSFDDKYAAYIIKSDENNSIIKLSGNVKPSNLPEDISFGDNIYITNLGILTTTLEDNNTYKHIGNIIINNNNELILSLISNQINYTT